jgi:hypothetical protein
VGGFANANIHVQVVFFGEDFDAGVLERIKGDAAALPKSGNACNNRKHESERDYARISVVPISVKLN